MMPINGHLEEIEPAKEVVRELDLNSIFIPIGNTMKCATGDMWEGISNYKVLQTGMKTGLSEQAMINFPARLRMAVLYAVAQSTNGRVANTSNLSEETVGYSTRYGDSVGDFAPLLNLTVSDVKEIGRELGLPESLIERVPSDGLCGMTDEEHLGFTYDQLDQWIVKGSSDDEEVDAKIEYLERKNRFKRYLMPAFYPRR